VAIEAIGSSDRSGWWFGLAGLVLVFVGFFGIDGGGSMGPDSPVAELAAEITDSPTRVTVGSTVGIVGALALVVFAAALRMRLGREGSLGELLALVAFAFGIIMAIGGVVHGSFRMATSESIHPNLLEDAILPLSILKEHVSDLFMLGAVGLVTTMSVASLSVGLLPRAYGWIGLALVVATVALIPTGLGVGGLTLFFWLIAACGVLIRGRSEIHARPR
jgi:hypothetical protein